ncbi:MAG: transglycosylase domain-containing protein [Anaerorhabdus sp.]
MDDKIKDTKVKESGKSAKKSSEQPGKSTKKASTNKSSSVSKKSTTTKTGTKKSTSAKDTTKPAAKKTGTTKTKSTTTSNAKTSDATKTKSTTKKASTSKNKTKDVVFDKPVDSDENKVTKVTKPSKHSTKKYIQEGIKDFESRLSEINLTVDDKLAKDIQKSKEQTSSITEKKEQETSNNEEQLNKKIESDFNIEQVKNKIKNVFSNEKSDDSNLNDPTKPTFDLTKVTDRIKTLISNKDTTNDKGVPENTNDEKKPLIDLTKVTEKIKTVVTKKDSEEQIEVLPEIIDEIIDVEPIRVIEEPKPSEPIVTEDGQLNNDLASNDLDNRNPESLTDTIIDIEPVTKVTDDTVTDESIKDETEPTPTEEIIETHETSEPRVTHPIEEIDESEYDTKKTIFGLPLKKENRSDIDETIIFKKITDDYQESEYEPKPKKKVSLGKKITASIIIIIICIGLIIGGVGLGILSQILSKTPELNLSDFTGAESSKIYDGDGAVVAELGAYLRENITYDDLPEAVVDSFVAIEDSRFFTHPGFDLPRFTKAFIENIKSMSFGQGGSTFTMQLVKNTYFSIDDIKNSVVAEKSIDRKVQEIYLALKIENDFSKEEIFEKYLNKLNFGGNIRGIQKASLYYFGKDICDVNLSEAALLAGIVNLPNKYNPYNYLELATQRRDTVLDMMAYHGYITKDESNLAKAIKVEDLLVGEEKTYNRTDSQHQSYIDAVIEEAQELTGKDPALSSMKIYTYMNQDVQNVIDSIQDGTAKIPFPDDLIQTAMISMDNRTGAIIGIGGGRNYEGARLLNRATSGFKQPGSAVKPFLSYALAFENLYWSSKHVLTDRPYTYRGSSLVLKNFDGKYRGDVMIDRAVAESLNIPAIDTLQQVIDAIGNEEVVKYLQTIGFSKVTNDNFDISYAIGGSSFETTVKEMAGAHAMLINSGVYNEPHTIQKIVMQDGTTIYPENQNVKVISTGSAYLVSELMLFAVNGPYYNYMQVLKRGYPVYAKTGTSDWGKDGMVYGIPKGASKDKWMIASSTQFTNAVWVGYDKGIKGKGTYFNSYKSGLNLTGKISVMLMDAAEKTSSTTPKAIERPSDIEDITYVLGSYPYAEVTDTTTYMAVTAEIRKGHPPLAPLSASGLKETPILSGINAYLNPDGSLSVAWHVNGQCANGTKDLTLNDGKNYIQASGACLFDPAIAGGGTSYFGTVYIDEVPLYNISSDNGYYSGWPGDLYGTIKVCGGATNKYGTSESQCAYAEWQETPLTN